MQAELLMLKDKIRIAAPLTDKDVRQVVDDHFKGIGWSILKDEWEKHMTEGERIRFCDKMLNKVK